jgi:hypothetical protein
MNRLFESSRLGDEETGHLLADWVPAVDIKEEPSQNLRPNERRRYYGTHAL